MFILLIKENPEIDLNFEFEYLLNRKSDSKTLYMKVDQKNITNTDTLSVCLPHPLTHRSSTFPPLGCLSIILGAGKNLSDEFILNTKVVQNSSTSTDTPLIRLSDVHDTSGMNP